MNQTLNSYQLIRCTMIVKEILWIDFERFLKKKKNVTNRSFFFETSSRITSIRSHPKQIEEGERRRRKKKERKDEEEEKKTRQEEERRREGGFFWFWRKKPLFIDSSYSQSPGFPSTQPPPLTQSEPTIPPCIIEILDQLCFFLSFSFFFSFFFPLSSSFLPSFLLSLLLLL